MPAQSYSLHLEVAVILRLLDILSRRFSEFVEPVLLLQSGKQHDLKQHVLKQQDLKQYEK
jgi:hypothetical protein